MLQTKIVTDLEYEPVSLSEVKEFLNIDYSDYDSVLLTLIKAARKSSEKVTGKAYGLKTIEVTGNTYTDSSGEVVKVYPITPFVSEVESTANDNYTYVAGYLEIPEDLKLAIMMRVATSFASRQDNLPSGKSVNASIVIERQYVSQLGA